jgi:hypothetical protein
VAVVGHHDEVVRSHRRELGCQPQPGVSDGLPGRRELDIGLSYLEAETEGNWDDGRVANVGADVVVADF